MTYRRFVCVWMFVLAFGMAHPAGGADAASFKPENKPENLKEMFELLQRTIHVKKDARQAVALFQSLIPDEARVRKSMKDNVSAEVIQQVLEFHKKMEIREADVGKLMKAEQTAVNVYAATTEEIARYEKDTVAFRKFPGGSKRFAEQFFRPGTTFYEVEFLEPGKDAGMKYHLFYWDGQQWSMLGPIWRAVK